MIEKDEGQARLGHRENREEGRTKAREGRWWTRRKDKARQGRVQEVVC